MDAGNWVALGAATVSTLISIVALLSAERVRRAEVERELIEGRRSRVWQVLTTEPGQRTIDAMDDTDGETTTRIRLLGRTANNLERAGAPELADSLRDVLTKAWGDRTDERSMAARERFRIACDRFMGVGRT